MDMDRYLSITLDVKQRHVIVKTTACHLTLGYNQLFLFFDPSWYKTQHSTVALDDRNETITIRL